jgi:hypothetical protein
MAHKLLLCFTNMFAEILVYVVGYCYCVEHHALEKFCHLLLPLKTSKTYVRKSCYFVLPKMLVKLALGDCTIKLFYSLIVVGYSVCHCHSLQT